MYEVSSLFQKTEGKDTEKLLRNVALVLKKAWQFPNETSVRIHLENLDIQTNTIPKKSVKQENPVKSSTKNYGAVSVHYIAPKFQQGDFLDEEQKLLDKVGFEIGTYLEKEEQQKTEDLLKRSAERNDRLTILGEIDIKQLPKHLKYKIETKRETVLPLEEMEKKYIKKVLASVDGNKTKAAKILQIDRKTLRTKLD